MNPEQRKKLRRARYKKIHGENWQEVLQKKHGDDWEAIIDSSKPDPETLTQKEYLKLVSDRIKSGDTSQQVVADLMRLYAEVKRWIGARTRPGKVGRPMCRKPEQGEEGIEDILRIEEARRQG